MLFGFLRRRAAEDAGRREPGVLDFTFGDPHEMQMPAYVEALREAAVPPRRAVVRLQAERAARRRTLLPPRSSAVVPLGWPGANLRMTTGGFGAITVAMKAVADPGDEVIYSLPPWFLYEILAIEAGLVPVKVPALQPSFDLDLDAIAAAITPRTRIVVVNTPNNPSGRVYPPATLLRALRPARAGLGPSRASHLAGLRRALQPDRLRRGRLPQPRGVLPVDDALLQLRQDVARPRPAARLPRRATRAARDRASSWRPSTASRSRAVGSSRTP